MSKLPNQVSLVEPNIECLLSAKSMHLRCIGFADDSIRLSNEIANHLIDVRGLIYKPRQTLIEAVSSILADLLSAASDDVERFSYRMMDSASFTGQDVGYTSFRAAIDRLQALGFVEVHRGYQERVQGGQTQGLATRFRATPALLEKCRSYGITPKNWREHFKPRPRPQAVQNPIILKSAKKVNQKARKKHRVITSRPMPIDMDHPKLIRAWDQVEDLNRYFADVRIDPDEHVGFQRIFNEGDHPAFDWDRGGRLYSIGGGYQMMKKEKRPFIRINGEATVELDLRASHFTILHSLLGWPFPDDDPYEVLPDIPRDIAKAWVNMVLGYDDFQTRWSGSAKRHYHKETRKLLQKEWPLKSVRDRLRPALPIMEAWLASDIRWGTLQYVESEIIVSAVSELALVHDVPALPVFDSLIVPASKAWITEGVLSDAFFSHTGIRPFIKAKGEAHM